MPALGSEVRKVEIESKVVIWTEGTGIFSFTETIVQVYLITAPPELDFCCTFFQSHSRTIKSNFQYS